MPTYIQKIYILYKTYISEWNDAILYTYLWNDPQKPVID